MTVSRRITRDIFSPEQEYRESGREEDIAKTAREVGQDQHDRAQPEFDSAQSQFSIFQTNVCRVPTPKIGSNA